MNDGRISIDPSKCSFCGRCTKACPTDAYEETRGYIVSFGGLFGNTIHKGEPIIPFIADHDRLLRVCDAAIGFFAENAKPSERFRFTIERVGEEVFCQKITEAYEHE